MKKKDFLKIKNAAEEEIEKLKQEYEILTKDIHSISNPILILACIIGVAILFSLGNGFFGFIGFVIFVYAFYTFANRMGHQEGYIDGYYEATHQDDKAAPDVNKSSKK